MNVSYETAVIGDLRAYRGNLEEDIATLPGCLLPALGRHVGGLRTAFNRGVSVLVSRWLAAATLGLGDAASSFGAGERTRGTLTAGGRERTPAPVRRRD